MVSSLGPQPWQPPKVVHFNRSKVCYLGVVDCQVTDMAGLNLVKLRTQNCSPEKAPDQRKQSSGQVMWVDGEERRKHLHPTLLSFIWKLLRI